MTLRYFLPSTCSQVRISAPGNGELQQVLKTSWEIIQSPEKEEENPVRRLARTKSGGRKLYLGRGLLGDNVSKQVYKDQSSH